MGATAAAGALTGGIRNFGSGVEARGRALGSSMRHVVDAAVVGEPLRTGIVPETYSTPTQFMSWVVSALGGPTTIPGSHAPEPETGRSTFAFVIVDKSLTRC